jgi:hypothetical protein
MVYRCITKTIGCGGALNVVFFMTGAKLEVRQVSKHSLCATSSFDKDADNAFIRHRSGRLFTAGR